MRAARHYFDGIRVWRLAALVATSGALAACGSGSNSTGGGPQQTTTPTCLDANGAPTTNCAVTPSGDTCSRGDANHCVPLTQLQVLADSGQSGPCVHLVYTNNCTQEIFADTCIQHGATTAPEWQCWTSSVLPHATIDVSQCQATGKYFFVSSTSSGQLDIYEQQCPAPQ